MKAPTTICPATGRDVNWQPADNVDEKERVVVASASRKMLLEMGVEEAHEYM